ncbi:MAG: APC family permease [Ignavibacteria bacterium]
MNSSSTSSGLVRSLGLKEATALNMIDMVGIGPFIVLPIVIQSMHGPHAIIAWLAGALLALVDGCIWAELGAAMPQAGGSFIFLRESYGKSSWGLLMSFLFIWQTVFQAPLVIASGAIGFSQYASYLIPVSPIMQKVISGSVVILIFLLLYRNIKDIGKISMFMWIAVVGTMLWLIISGGLHFNPDLAFGGMSEGPSFMSSIFFVGLGHAMLKTVYSYLGYYNVCHLGGEISKPEIVIPKSIILSIFGITMLYCAMHLSIVGVIPWQEAKESTFIVSTFIERLHGPLAAQIATGLILFIAFASLFSVTLGYSRIPYAAAKEGAFFRMFATVHPKEHFPHVSLMVLCGIAFVFSLLFRMSEIISAIVAMRALVQFIGGAIGLILLRKRNTIAFPWKMPLYPLPIIMAILIWLGLFLSTGYYALMGIAFILIGIIVYLFMAHKKSSFPFSGLTE